MTPRPQHGLYIEAVTVCVNYADFLAEFLTHNLQHFDELVVVTSFDDKETKKLCDHRGVPCVMTDLFTENGDSFNKSKAINLGLDHLHHKGWILNLDADIILPQNFRKLLSRSRLNPECIYGADRSMVTSHKQWTEIKARFPEHQLVWMQANPACPLGGRVLHREYGYCPIGYFQLWNSRMNHRYPVNHGSADETDILFACKWRPDDRRLLPGVFTYHLDSEPLKSPGKNWTGRKTRRFGPTNKNDP